jgi:hypothetical protein
MKNKRIIQVYREDKWQEIEFEELKKDDKFRMFDNGIPVKDDKKNFQWIALSDAFLNDKKLWTINTQGVQHETSNVKEG